MLLLYAQAVGSLDDNWLIDKTGTNIMPLTQNTVL